MSHNYNANYIHCVFSTKGRRDIPAQLQERLWSYIGGIVRKLGCELVAIGGTANHVHVLFALRPMLRLAEAIQATSSRWLGEQGVKFEWQKGYGAFSVSPSMLETVTAYVRRQPEHHSNRNFEDEFLALLRKTGVAFDPLQPFA